MLKQSFTRFQAKVLITGTNGQLGPELASHLRKKYGNDNVLCSSRTVDPSSQWAREGPAAKLDVTKYDDFLALAKDFGATCIIHFAAMLSAVSEKNPTASIEVNMRGTEHALEVATATKAKIFVPSSIGAFGPSTPRELTPDVTVQRPTYLYGIAKVYAELLGDWYHRNRDVDFRSLRYPGIISYKSLPGGGTTDWACHAYFKAVSEGKYSECFVEEDTMMPMMYIDDVVLGTTKFLEADESILTQRTYNVNGISFSPAMQEKSIQRRIDGFKIDCLPDFRQYIADSWPISLDDSAAKKDWGWAPAFDLDKMTDTMIDNIK